MERRMRAVQTEREIKQRVWISLERGEVIFALRVHFEQVTH